MSPAAAKSVFMLSVMLAVLVLTSEAAGPGPGPVNPTPLDFPICLASCGQQVMRCANECALQGATIGGLLCIASCSNDNLMCAGSCTGVQTPPTHPPVRVPRVHA